MAKDYSEASTGPRDHRLDQVVIPNNSCVFDDPALPR